MSVGHFLRGRARANPGPEAPPDERWWLARRRPDWPWTRNPETVLRGEGPLDEARAELLAPSGLLAPLDLVTIGHASQRGLLEEWVVGDDRRGVPLPHLARVRDGEGGLSRWSREMREWVRDWGDQWRGAWATCPQGPWLIQLAEAAGVEAAPLVAAAVARLPVTGEGVEAEDVALVRRLRALRTVGPASGAADFGAALAALAADAADRSATVWRTRLRSGSIAEAVGILARASVEPGAPGWPELEAEPSGPARMSQRGAETRSALAALALVRLGQHAARLRPDGPEAAAAFLAAVGVQADHVRAAVPFAAVADALARRPPDGPDDDGAP